MKLDLVSKVVEFIFHLIVYETKNRIFIDMFIFAYRKPVINLEQI